MKFINKKIHTLCNQYNITNYTINEDGTIDVNGDVLLYNIGLSQFPLLFRNVSGCFDISNNNLTTLKGCPERIGGGFYVYNNKLTSLIDGPKYVGTHYNCCDNNLISLNFSPSIIYGTFYCDGNKLSTLEGCPSEVISFECGYNELTTLEGCPKIIEDFGCYNNKLTSLKGSPKQLLGRFNCSNNNLDTLKGGPLKVGGHFDCSSNKLRSFEYFPMVTGKLILNDNRFNIIYNLFNDKNLIDDFNDYDIIRGNIIIYDRLKEFLEDYCNSTITKEKLIELVKNKYNVE